VENRTGLRGRSGGPLTEVRRAKDRGQGRKKCEQQRWESRVRNLPSSSDGRTVPPVQGADGSAQTRIARKRRTADRWRAQRPPPQAVRRRFATRRRVGGVHAEEQAGKYFTGGIARRAKAMASPEARDGEPHTDIACHHNEAEACQRLSARARGAAMPISRGVARPQYGNPRRRCRWLAEQQRDAGESSRGAAD